MTQGPGSQHYTAHRSNSRGNISKFWTKDEGVRAKVAFSIQSQRYLWSEAV